MKKMLSFVVVLTVSLGLLTLTAFASPSGKGLDNGHRDGQMTNTDLNSAKIEKAKADIVKLQNQIKKFEAKIADINKRAAEKADKVADKMDKKADQVQETVEKIKEENERFKAYTEEMTKKLNAQTAKVDEVLKAKLAELDKQIAAETDAAKKATLEAEKVTLTNAATAQKSAINTYLEALKVIWAEKQKVFDSRIAIATKEAEAYAAYMKAMNTSTTGDVKLSDKETRVVKTFQRQIDNAKAKIKKLEAYIEALKNTPAVTPVTPPATTTTPSTGTTPAATTTTTTSN